MSVIWVVFLKEFLDIVRDRRRFIWTLIASFVVFPVLFVVPYAYLITRVTKQSVDVLTLPVQGMENAPALVAYLAEEDDIQTIPAQDVRALVRDKKYAVGLIIPDEFEERLAEGRSVEVIVVADLRRSMDFTGSRLGMVLRQYNQSLLETRLEQRGIPEDYLAPLVVKQENAATATETTGSLLGLIIPGAIISLGLSAGMPIAISTIAGEKKKLTLEPVLFTTVSRFKLVFAKLLAVLASVFLTLLGMMISGVIAVAVMVVVLSRTLPLDRILPSMEEAAPASVPAASTSTVTPDMLTGGYDISLLAILLFLLAPLLIVLFGAALQLLVSAWARNDEEATAYLTPLSLFSGLVIFIAIFLDEFTPQLWHYGLPVFGTILSMRDLLSNRVDPASLTVMFLSSAFYAALMLGLAVWMFHREEVVFRT